jgi:4-hydroxybenzoate polyprenyltransferase
MKFLSSLRTVLVLGRVSNLPTIWTNVLVGWFLAGGGWVAELGWIALGMSLVYVAGMTLNDAFDAKWDREHAPTRPIPSGRISEATVWTLGALQLVAGLVIPLSLTSVHPLFVVLLLIVVLLYNWLHKRYAASVLLMGACRALVYIGSASAVVAHTDSIMVPQLVYLIAGGVVIYIAGLTLAARSEHLASPGGLKPLPRVMLTLPVLFPLFSFQYAAPSPASYALAGLGAVGVWSWLLVTRGALREKLPRGIAYAIAGIAFFDAATVSFADWRAAVVCLVCFILTLGAQRVIPAT